MDTRAAMDIPGEQGNLVYDMPDIASLLASAPLDVLEAAPFGIVGLECDGEVFLYNRFEQELSGLSAADVVGRHFFLEIALCTNNALVRKRYMDAWEHGTELDVLIPYTFAYRMKPTKVQLRLLVRGNRGWLLVRLV